MGNETIKQKADSSYYFRLDLGFNSNGKRIQKRRDGFRTKKEAREAYRKLLNEKETYLQVPKKILSIKEYIDAIFLPWYKTTVKSQTYQNRISIVEKHFSYFDAFDIDGIEPLDVQRWQSTLSETLKPSYVRAVQGFFSQSMDKAVSLNLVNSNPSKSVRNVKKVKPQIEFWTKEEFEKVISVIDTGDYYGQFLFPSLWLLFMTGARIREAAALRWSDLDFSDGLLTINKNLIYKNKSNFTIGEPKTKAGNRKIALDESTLEVLSSWKEVQDKVINTQFILSYDGFPTQKHTISYAIKRYSKLVDVHSIRVHDLRHSHASLLIELGENAIVIRDRLGHEDIETTLGTYGHLYPNTNKVPENPNKEISNRNQ